MSKPKKIKGPNLKALRSELERCHLMGVRAGDSRRMGEMQYWACRSFDLTAEILRIQLSAMPQKIKDMFAAMPPKPRRWISRLLYPVPSPSQK